jgi:hypothetical protein
LIFADSREELKAATRMVLKTLKENNLTINIEKSEFCKTSLIFLGHELSEDEFAIDKAKANEVLSFKDRQPAQNPEVTWA